MVKDYYKEINGRLTDDINMFTGGINSYMDKAFIEPEQMPYCMNMTMYQPPMMCTRASREDVSIGKVTPNESSVVAMWAYNDRWFICIVRPTTSTGGNAHFCWIDTATHSRTVSSREIPWSEQYYFCYCRTAVQEYLYLLTDNYKLKFEISAIGLGTDTPILDGHYGRPAFHKGRLFFANPSTNIITYSALYDFDNFTPMPDPLDPDTDYSSYAGDFFVTNSKGAITNVVSFDDKLVIFAEHSMHLLYGSSPIVGSSSQFQLVDMNNNLGCIATKSIAIGGGYLFWLGDDNEIYSYTGSSLDMVSRPNSSRYVQRNGGISNIPLMPNQWSIGYDSYPEVCATATSDKYYITLPINYYPISEENIGNAYPIFVFDVYNKVWWAEDGGVSAICNLSFGINRILIARNGEVLTTTNDYCGKDHLRDENNEKIDVPIKYEFHTRVYGADGVNSRKTLSKVWVQASANADVYLTDSWTTTNYWTGPFLKNTLKKIGTLEQKGRDHQAHLPNYEMYYDSGDYEQQVCYVEKMYGQRLNTFQVVVKGEGASKFYLMKREWSAR